MGITASTAQPNSTISQKSSLDNKVAGDDKLYFSDTGLARLLANLATLKKRLASVKITVGYLVGRNLTSVERSIMAWDLM